MVIANHQPQYLPYLGFFHKIRQCACWVVLDDVQFLERGHQHRNLIKMQTGTQWLTVPVRQRRGQLIREVEIDTTSSWRKKHWAALQTNYGPAPFFKQVSPALRDILLGGTHTRLVDLDMDLLRWAMSELGIDIPMHLSSELGVEGGPNERHIAICKKLGADTYLSGAGGRQYMDVAMYEAAGITVRFQEFVAREYTQLFPKHGFIANLAVIDALFNLGPGARDLIA